MNINISILTSIPAPPTLFITPSFIHFIQRNHIQVTNGIVYLPLYWSLELDTLIDDKGRERARISETTFLPIPYYQIHGPYPSNENPRFSLISAVNAEGKTLKTIGPFQKYNYWEADNARKSLIEYLNEEYPGWTDPFAYWTKS